MTASLLASMVESLKELLRKSVVAVYMGCWVEALEEEGLPSRSVAIIDHIKEPLYLIGLEMLLTIRLIGPIAFIIMEEEEELTVVWVILVGDSAVMDVPAEKTISFGR